MSDNFEYDKIVQEHRGSYHNGRFKLNSNYIQFKNSKTSKTDQIQLADVDNAEWCKRSKGYCLKVTTNTGNTQRYDGFQDTDFKKLDEIISKVIKKPIQKSELSVKGWNWGKTGFTGDSLNFEIDGKLGFEVPLKNVSNANASKNEGILQFHQNEDSNVSLMEIRFHIPSENDIDSANEFVKKVLNNADIISADGDAICTLAGLNCLTPRGRYDVKFFIDFIDLHGKTFDYKIPYNHILRLFLLPHKDNRQMYFVIALDPPIKQGQTRYQYLIVLFNNDDNISVDLSISDKTKERFGERIEKLEKNISGPYHEVVSRICRAVLDKRITVPGNFNSSSSAKCLPCSYKANSGFLYPLERGFMFVHKPPLHILFQDIASVTFSRSNQGHVRSFDFEIDHKNGTKHMFNGIEKNEQERLQEFVNQKSIAIKKSGKEYQSTYPNIVSDDEEKVHDAYAERMKAEGRERVNEDDVSGSDDASDADFVAPSESDDDLEYDSNASVSDSDDSNDKSVDHKGSKNKSDEKKK